MRIGIDARELCGHATGAGRYLSGLLHAWADEEAAQRHQVVLYVPEPLSEQDAERVGTRTLTRVVPGVPNTWWEQVRLAQAVRADGPDVFFAPAYTAPLILRTPTVVAIHDVSFVTHPEWFRTGEGLRRRFVTRQSAAQARAVVTISEFSRREILEVLHVPPLRVHVIPPGLALHTPRDAAAASEERLLFVGSIFNRRHVPRLVRAFGILARRHPLVTLDLVGDNRTYPREDIAQLIAVQGLTDRVRWHRYVSDQALRDLYGRARAFAFLSEYEGLGLTPLEALAHDVPPVLLDTPVARESCGDAALYVALDDAMGTAKALERALYDATTRSRLLAAAPATLAGYSWTRAASDTLALLEACATAS